MRNKISINLLTIGCRLNQSETATIYARLVADRSFQIVTENTPSDVTIINTCTVTAKGDNDARKFISRARRLNPKVKIALVGCQAQTQKDQLLKINNVRWVIGNAQKFQLPEIIKDSYLEDKTFVITPEIEREDFTITAVGNYPNHTRANLKIQDGCDFFCSYCEVPYARGRSRSRDFNNLIGEAEKLAKKGHQEIILTGVNVGTYKNGKYSLLDVIAALNDVSEIARLRLSSIEPKTFDKRIFEHMFPKGKLCRFLHIPVQTGDENVLKKMGRNHNFQEFAEIVNSACEKVSEICLGTDVIVGFPGETDKHFENTVKNLTSLPLKYIHVFTYSPRPNARSRNLIDDVNPIVKTKRSKILRDLSIKKRMEYYRSITGKRLDVLFEEKKDGYWSGLTDHFIRVHIQSNSDLRNKLVPVNIVKTARNQVFGEIA